METGHQTMGPWMMSSDPIDKTSWVQWCARNSPYEHISSQVHILWHHSGSLYSAMMETVTSQNLANAVHPRWHFSEAIASIPWMSTYPRSRKVRWPQQQFIIHRCNTSGVKYKWVQGSAQVCVPNPHVICHCHSNTSLSFPTYELMIGSLFSSYRKKKRAATYWMRENSCKSHIW